MNDRIDVPDAGRGLRAHWRTRRARRRGKITYYFYDWGGKPRREESLGTDYVKAVGR
jgi:hypothetical protein